MLRKPLVERKPLADAHTCTSLQKRKKHVAHRETDLTLDHLQPLASLPLPSEAIDAIHLAVSGAVINADHIQAIASGRSPPLFASPSAAPDTVWVTPLVSKTHSIDGYAPGACFYHFHGLQLCVRESTNALVCVTNNETGTSFHDDRRGRRPTRPWTRLKLHRMMRFQFMQVPGLIRVAFTNLSFAGFS
jgi:hypothetical protein